MKERHSTNHGKQTKKAWTPKTQHGLEMEWTASKFTALKEEDARQINTNGWSEGWGLV